jgi:hypothetical protein
MSFVLIGVLCLAAFILLMLLGIPIPFAMLFPGVIGLAVMLSPAAATQVMSSNILSYFSNYTLTVGPLFGLMGFFASYSGVGSNLFGALDSYMGHRRGGWPPRRRWPAPASARSAVPFPRRFQPCPRSRIRRCAKRVLLALPGRHVYRGRREHRRFNTPEQQLHHLRHGDGNLDRQAVYGRHRPRHPPDGFKYHSN